MTDVLSLKPEVLKALQAVDTPTVCNALEIVMGGRTTEGFTKIPVVCADPTLPAMVGFARTARIRASQPSKRPAAEMRELRLAYYDYVAAGDGPNVVVIEDADWPDQIGAFWGEVNVAIHKGLGVAGTLTNGLLRDLGDLDDGYQVVAGALGPSHAFVHVEEIDCPVSLFGLDVRPGELIHADRHGAAVIPAEYIDVLPEGIDTITRKEAPILKAARAPGFSPEKLRIAWGEAEDVH